MHPKAKAREFVDLLCWTLNAANELFSELYRSEIWLTQETSRRAVENGYKLADPLPE